MPNILDDLAVRSRAGDAQARAALANELAPLVRYWARRLSYGHPSDDLVQEGLLAVLLLTNQYQPGGADSFLLLATRAICRALRAYLKREHRYANRHKYLGRSEAERMAASTGPALDDRLWEALPPRKRSVIVWYFGLEGHRPMTLEGTARQLGVSKQRVHQILRAPEIFD